MNNKGFTLIELIISAAIFSFLITGMVIMLLQQQRQFNFTKEIADIDTTGRAVLNLIASEIRNSGARQGKSFSLKFINGGSDPDNLCVQSSSQEDIPNKETGSVNSPPDCITIYTWDLTAGMTTINDAGNPELNIPSTTETSLFFSNQGAQGLLINLPENYFNGSKFIGTINKGSILIGFRSRQKKCNPNILIQRTCNDNPSRCSECGMVFRAVINKSQRTAKAVEVIEHNFPTELFPPGTEFEQFIEGVDDEASNDSFGFISSINSGPMEYSLIQSTSYRVDTDTRGLRRALNLGNYTIIAGGNDGDNNQNFLEAPGIVDLQFVLNLEDADGGTTRVGICDIGVCNDEDRRIFSDFTQDTVLGREQDIRSVEINLVLKSKIRPRQQSGNFYKQTIPPIADVAQRVAPNKDGTDDSLQSVFNEPQNGFIYRVFTTTVYLRNLAREDQI